MREILFRGKNKKGEWVYGYPVPTTTNCYDKGFEIIDMDGIEYDELDGFNPMFGANPVATETIGQFTGLTDKNGKKIFEGDILTIARKMDGMGTYYVPSLASPVNVEVKWDFCGWMWETLCEDKRYLQFPDAWCYFECEVIGNIHDNPELLEGGV